MRSDRSNTSQYRVTLIFNQRRLLSHRSSMRQGERPVSQ
ncbi:hypothetical protein ACPOL_3834 [Acidisarcina polymorpha]|uniref:Uncharacterized protein n=1 Tax=Acidisarcina polymorpha TaxID=2211140 RepID=A0A2Z5G1Q8_9BACT|nr:hypothetical protein ACPOL_3834 [Acidisarcina polymorpha]